ncbi:hypothetical protein [uncultured Enterovirga sp.]|uniref:hypothetical protein n=1 Tax=uncultured Enterovirga sp. TaxID=2026352 RepID=UPI0035CC18CF
MKKFHPDWVLWVCLSDEHPPGFQFDIVDELFDHVLWARDLAPTATNAWIFKHNVIELCTAVKGLCLNAILSAGAEAVIYIDPDIALFGPLGSVVEALTTNSVVLTPHLVDAEVTKSAIWENERSALMHGVYNLGFLAVRNSREGRRFGSWWQDRLIEFCYEAAEQGVYTDQRWCDLVPAFFEEVFVLRDPGYNVASWNLSRRFLTTNKSGDILVNGSPLRFYHFTKVEGPGAAMIERYGLGSPIVFELLEWYRSAIGRCQPAGIPPKWWAYGQYSDGTAINYQDRVLYRSEPGMRERFPEPFEADTYLAWLRSEGQRAV